jgi:NAD-dependent SIR2 family protein deacetylase
MMADMVKRAKLCCAYTGAGLSKSSGIPDYATKAASSVVATVSIKGEGLELN